MIAIDTNILIYASGENDDDPRRAAALDLLQRAGGNSAIVPLQVIGEYISVCRRKGVLPFSGVMGRVDLWLRLFETPATAALHYLRAAGLSERFGLQFFDALIVTVAMAAGSEALLSEDMQDGLRIEGLHILNPFNPANRERIDRLLAAPG